MMNHLGEWLCCAEKAKRIALIAHTSPDGDTVGAVLALRLAFLSAGKAVDVILDGTVPREMRFLSGTDAFILPEQTEGLYDAAIAVDVAERRMMGRAQDVFDSAVVRMVVDHHATNAGYGDYNYIRGDECACCVLAYEIIQAMRIPITVDMGTCLMLGLSTDTGHFMYAYTTALAFEIAAHLRGIGVDVSDITRRLYRSAAKSRVELMKVAYQKLRFVHDGCIGVIELSREEIEKTGCTIEQTGGLVNVALEVEGVRMAVLATEREEGVKLSLRAVEPDTVNDIAKWFGGGGHAQAAGVTMHMPMREAVETVLAAMAEKLL